MRTATKKNRATFDLELTQHFSRQRWIDIRIFGIVLDAAGVVNLAACDAELRPSIDIFLLLHADQIKKPERARDKKSKSSKASFGPVRQTTVNHRNRSAPPISN